MVSSSLSIAWFRAQIMLYGSVSWFCFFRTGLVLSSAQNTTDALHLWHLISVQQLGESAFLSTQTEVLNLLGSGGPALGHEPISKPCDGKKDRIRWQRESGPHIAFLWPVYEINFILEMTWKLERGGFLKGKWRYQCHTKMERILGNKLQYVFLLLQSHTEVPLLSTCLWHLCFCFSALKMPSNCLISQDLESASFFLQSWRVHLYSVVSLHW